MEPFFILVVFNVLTQKIPVVQLLQHLVVKLQKFYGPRNFYSTFYQLEGECIPDLIFGRTGPLNFIVNDGS